MILISVCSQICKGTQINQIQCTSCLQALHFTMVKHIIIQFDSCRRQFHGTKLWRICESIFRHFCDHCIRQINFTKSISVSKCLGFQFCHTRGLGSLYKSSASVLGSAFQAFYNARFCAVAHSINNAVITTVIIISEERNRLQLFTVFERNSSQTANRAG